MLISVKILYFYQQYGVAVIILKTERSLFITREAFIVADEFKICKFIHSLSLIVPFPSLCINDLRELCKRYSQLKCEMAPEQFRFST